jgi:hypothetical protein
VPEVLNVILSLPHIRRAPGMSGRLHSLAEAASASEAGVEAEQEAAGVHAAVYLNAQGEVAAWPTSLTVQVRMHMLGLIV